MLRNNNIKRQHTIYIKAFLIYFLILIISIFICLFANAKDYIYLLVIMGVSITYFLLFISACYEVLTKVNNCNIEEIKMKYINTSFERTLLNIKNNSGFDFYNDIFYKSFKDKKSNYIRYIYVSNLDSLDMALEEFLHKSINLLDNKGNAYFELFIIMFPKRNDDYSTESHKEINVNYYIFSNNKIPLRNKLIKCLVYSDKLKTLYYNKNNIYKGSIDAYEFIESDLIKHFY